MKNTKLNLITALFLLFSIAATAQEHETLTIASATNVAGVKEILLDVNGVVETQTWDKNYVKVILEVKSKGANKEVVRHLKSNNRFAIITKKTGDDHIQLSAPNMKSPVYINGKELEETISYRIYAPRHTTINKVPVLAVDYGPELAKI